MDEINRDLMEENGFGPRLGSYFGLDFDLMHGVWVSNLQFPGSYGRIAYRQDQTRFWIRWTDNAHGSIKLRQSASLVEAKDLKMLLVEPDPWFVKCRHCGNYGLPLGYVNMQKRASCVVT